MSDDLRPALEALADSWDGPRLDGSTDWHARDLRAVLADHPAAPARQTVAAVLDMVDEWANATCTCGGIAACLPCQSRDAIAITLADHPATPDDLRAVIEALADSWDGPRLDGSQDWHARELRAALSGTEGEA